MKLHWFRLNDTKNLIMSPFSIQEIVKMSLESTGIAGIPAGVSLTQSCHTNHNGKTTA